MLVGLFSAAGTTGNRGSLVGLSDTFSGDDWLDLWDGRELDILLDDEGHGKALGEVVRQDAVDVDAVLGVGGIFIGVEADRALVHRLGVVGDGTLARAGKWVVLRGILGILIGVFVIAFVEEILVLGLVLELHKFLHKLLLFLGRDVEE